MITVLLEYLLWVSCFAVTIAVLAHVRWMRSRPVIVHWLWTLLLVKMLIPPIVFWPWTLASSPIELPLLQQTEMSTFPPTEDSISSIGLHEAGPRAAVNQSPSEVGFLADLSPWLLIVGFSIWIVGVVFQATRLTLFLFRLRCLRQRSLEARTDLSSSVDRIAKQMSVRAPEVKLVPGLPGPVVFGFRKSYLLWPANVVEFDRLDETQVRMLITHELAHLKRRDQWHGFLHCLVLILWWWFPLARWVVRQTEHWSERCCDTWVDRLQPESGREYANLLIQLSSTASVGGSIAARQLSPVCGLFSVHRSKLKDRLLAVLSPSTETTARGNYRFAVVLAVAAVLMFPHLTIVQSNERSGAIGDRGPTANSSFAYMEYLASRGGRWIAAAPGSASQGDLSIPVQYEYRFEWGTQKKFLKAQILGVLPDRSQEVYSDIMIFWHPTRHELQFHQYSADGSIAAGTSVIQADGSERLRYTRTAVDGTTSLHQYLNQRISDHEFVTYPETLQPDRTWHKETPLRWTRAGQDHLNAADVP